jgi:hypothetical protein
MTKGEYTSLDLTAAHIGGIFSLWESKFTGALGMHGLEVGGMVVANVSNFKEIDLQFAHIGQLNLGGSKVTGSLNMQGVQIAGHLVMTEGEYTSLDLTLAGNLISSARRSPVR